MSFATYVEKQRTELISQCEALHRQIIAEIETEIADLQMELARRERANVSPELNLGLCESISVKTHNIEVINAIKSKQINNINEFAHQSIKEEVNAIEKQL